MSGKVASWNEARSRLGDMEEIWRRYGGDIGWRRCKGAREWDLERKGRGVHGGEVAPVQAA